MGGPGKRFRVFGSIRERADQRQEAGRPRLRFRRGTDVTRRFPEVAAAVEALEGDDLVLDGELVVLTEEGQPDFQGLVAKRALSAYVGGRSRDWRKFPVHRTGEFVVVGFTPAGLGREGGVHLASARGRRLVYAGRVGTGFEPGALGAARELLGRRPVAAPPCTGATPRGRGHTWVEPRVVCEVVFREQTDDGLLRQPVFVRFRPDKTHGQTRPFSRARIGRG